MSYILDALRRAEAERTSMQPPDLNRLATAAATPVPPRTTQQPARRAWALLAIALVIGMVVATLVMLSARQKTPAPPPVASASQPPAATSADAPSPPVARAPESFASDASTATPSLDLPRNPLIEREAPARPAVADPAALPAAAPPPASSATAAKPANAESTAHAGGRPAAPPNVQVQATPASSPAALQAASQPVALPSRDELPPDVRRTLPPFGIGGTVYSPDPSRRMLIVDGELWREGDQIRPDLFIEQIRPRDAVLRYRGLRFSVAP